MFTLGFPPVPFSITNINVDRRFAKDITNPFSLLEFIKTVANLVESNNVTAYYSHYITTWNNFKNKKTSTSNTLIVEGYRSFVKDLTLNYNSEAENKFLSTIDYSDPYDLDVAMKFIAAKIKSIADYYRTKREEVKLEPIRKKYKASTKGFISSIKEKIVEFLTNNADQTVISNIDTIASNLNVNVDPLYDAETGYFNKQPNQDVYGQYDRDYNEDIFLKNNVELVAKVFAGLSTANQNSQEVYGVLDNKRELTKKYMGTDFFYISATPVISNVPVLSVTVPKVPPDVAPVRYNQNFIKVVTTTKGPTTTNTTTGGPTTTVAPTTGGPTTTTTTPTTTQTPPTTSSFGSDDYDCVNFTCLRRKGGAYKSKAACSAACKKPPEPPGPPGPTNPPTNPPKQPPKPDNKCDCKNIIFSSTGPYLEDPGSYDATLNVGTKNCIEYDAFVTYKVQDNITWVCSNSSYEIRYFDVVNPSDGTTYIASGGQTGGLGLWTSTFLLDCTADVNTATQYRLTIVYKPTGAFTDCYFWPGSESVTYSGPPYEEFQLKQLTCCDGGSNPSGGGGTGDTTTTTTTPTTDCPECDGPPSNPDPPPNEPPTTVDTTTECPPCQDGGSGGSDESNRGRPKSYDVKEPSTPGTSTTTTTTTTTNTPTSTTPSLS